MSAITKEAKLAGLRRLEPPSEISASVGLLQNTFLSEIPGLAFAVLTLAYIVSSFATLAL